MSCVANSKVRGLLSQDKIKVTQHKRGTLMMENLTHDETGIGHNRLKLVGIKNFMDS